MSDSEEFVKGDARKYFREGQRHVTPVQGDATRGFYESLLEEKPDSPMAIRFCIEYGILGGERHATFLKKYNKLKEAGAFNANKIALDKLLVKSLKAEH
jgi:hypothetical protein